MNSTGTPALFLHAADAIHGDLGMVQQNDIVIIISKSGDSPEIKLLVPFVKNFGNKIIAIAGNAESFLAKNADFFINTTVEQEACPHNLAPTTSSTAQMVMGDALAICLMGMKEFSTGDFAKYHPGGILGKKLYLKVGDMVLPEENPSVLEDTPIKEVLLEITKKRLGAAAVLGKSGEVLGIITDGDIRRMLEKHDEFIGLTASQIMTINPKQIDAQALAAEAYTILKSNNINQLVVLENGHYKGILHIQDIMREGIIF
jgi:arabinose-5-phosphate isomerase